MWYFNKHYITQSLSTLAKKHFAVCLLVGTLVVFFIWPQICNIIFWLECNRLHGPVQMCSSVKLPGACLCLPSRRYSSLISRATDGLACYMQSRVQTLTCSPFAGGDELWGREKIRSAVKYYHLPQERDLDLVESGHRGSRHAQMAP